MRASQLTQSLALAGLLIASVAHAGPMGFDPSLKESKLEAGAPCADGSCYNFDKDGGLSGVEAQVHKINIFSPNGKDPRFHQSLTGAGKKYASVGRVVPNQPILWPDDKGKVVPTTDIAGSGFMISPCLFFTNYHVVFGKSTQPNSRDFSVTFNSTGKAVGRPIAWGPKAQTGLPGDDWAIVELEADKCLGLETGWMIPGMLSPNDLKKKDFTIAGYPADKNEGTASANLYVSKKAKAHSFGANGFAGTFLLDGAGTGGTSGGPVFYEDENGTPNYIGIFSANVKNNARVLRKYDQSYANVAIDAVAILGKGDNLSLLTADIRKHGSPVNRMASR